MNYRSDINGLRGWAVLAVILYHYRFPWFSGGFVGVDIFFVISGYLMTSIVFHGLECGNFSVSTFYSARVRRIVPALLFMCIILLVAGFFSLGSLDYSVLAKQVIYSLGFLSNFKFWSEADYFDADSHEKWLLHTWSLSVEWQFYLILPIAMVVIWERWRGRNGQLWLLGLGFVFSFLSSVLLTRVSSGGAFFLFPMRAWEMLSGGLVFLLEKQLPKSVRWRYILELTGFLLIIFSILYFDAGFLWPGWLASFPVLGAMLVLAAQREGSIWTSSVITQWLGKNSYSLYLWHWPIFVFLIFIGLHDRPMYAGLGLLLTFITGVAFRTWIEDPSRRFLSTSSISAWRLVFVLYVFAICIAALIISRGGFPERFRGEVDVIATASADINPRREECHSKTGVTSPSCVWGGRDWRVIALGDSHLSAVVSAIAAAGGSRAGVVQWSYSGCPYVLGMKLSPEVKARQTTGYQCEGFIAWANDRLDHLSAELPLVIVSRYASGIFGANEAGSTIQRPSVYFSTPYTRPNHMLIDEFSQAIVETACNAARRRMVFLVRPIPEIGVNVPKTISRKLAFGIVEDVALSREEYMARNSWVWAAQDEAARRCGVKILDPTKYLCDSAYCYASRGRKPLYSDDDHLSETGNKLLVPMFSEVFALRN